MQSKPPVTLPRSRPCDRLLELAPPLDALAAPLAGQPQPTDSVGTSGWRREVEDDLDRAFAGLLGDGGSG